MQAQLRIFVGRIVHQSHIGDDDRVHPEIDCKIHRALPLLPGRRLRIGVERHQHTHAVQMRVANPFAHGFLVKIEPGEIARIGFIANAHIDIVGTIIDGRRQREERASRAYQFHSIGTIRWRDRPTAALRQG